MTHRALAALLLASCALLVAPARAEVAATGGGGESEAPEVSERSLDAASLSPRRVAERFRAFSAIADSVDSFLVYKHTFDGPDGSCAPRGWRAEDRAGKIFAHVDGSHLVNDSYVSMGTKALWFGADLASHPAEVHGWIVPSGYGNNWSQRLTSPTFSLAAHPAAVLRFDAKVALRRDFTLLPDISAMGLVSGKTGQEFFGAQALLSNGRWAHLTGRYAQSAGATWPTTRPLFSNFWTAAVTGTPLLGSLGQVAVDDTGNVYVVDFGNSRVVKYDRSGAARFAFGSNGTGNGQFFGAIGIAVDANVNIYVVDSGNNRVQKFDNVGNYVTQWGSFGSGAGQFNTPGHAAVDAAGNVYVTDLYNSRVQKFTGAGVFVSEFGNTPGPGFLARPMGIVVAPDGTVYVTDIDPSSNRIAKFTSAGVHVVSFGALSAGGEDGTTVEPTGLAIDRDGFLWVADKGNNRVQRFDVSTPLPTFLTKIGQTNHVSLNVVAPVGVAVHRNGSIYVSESGRNRVDHHSIGGPFAGFGVLKYEVLLDQDGNEALGLAEPLQVRVVMQTNIQLSCEDGAMVPGDDAIVLVDNITLSDGGGDILTPLDFEDGTTGSWTLSARNGYWSSVANQASIIRDVVPGTQPQLQAGYDANDPTCVWTFPSPSGFVGPGLYASLTSPWIAKARSDSSNVIVGYASKLNARDQNIFLQIRIRGKKVGDTHATFIGRMAFILFGANGASDLGVPFDPTTQYSLTDGQSFTIFNTAKDSDSLQLVFEVSDQSERFGADPATRPSTRLPIFDDMFAIFRNVDSDYDGVRDSQDLDPAICAAGRDADGNGRVDEGATLKHLETWANARRPVHFALSQNGHPDIHDGSDITALRDAFATWQAVPGADVPLVEDPLTAQTNAVAGDGVNLLTFEDDYGFPANVLAITPTLSYTRRGPFDDTIALPGQIVDADIIFNPAARFRTATAGPTTGSFDLESVAVHEIGHFLGLSHTGAQDATMFPVLQSGTLAASLESDDRAAVAAAYPSATFATDFGAIRGVLRRGNSATPIPGALVLAVQLDGGGAPLDTVASDYTDESGAYALLRLPAGTYGVRVAPLDGSVPGLVPGAINAQIDATAQTNFQAEWYGGPESAGDNPDVRAPVTVVNGATQAGIDILSNVDLVPPTVVNVSPAATDLEVRIDTPVLVTFSEPIEANTLSSAFRFRKLGQSGSLGGSGQLLTPGVSFVFVPNEPLEFATDYEVQLTTALLDREGNAMVATHSSTFRTQDRPPVAIADIQPREAPAGALVTISGAGFDATPGAQNRVYFSTPGGTDFVLGTLVEPTSMVAQVPANAVSGPVKVVTGIEESNLFSFGVLVSQVVAPSPIAAPIALSFDPSDVVVAPDANTVFTVGGGKFARINLDPARPNLRIPMEVAVAGATRIALSPNGLSAWITSPAQGLVSEVDTDPSSATYGVVLGSVAVPGAPQGIVVAANGQRAYVTDEDSDRVFELGVDHSSGGSNRTLLREIVLTGAVFTGGLALEPNGTTLLLGTDNQGLLALDLSTTPPTVSVRHATPVAGGVAVTPSGTRVLAIAGGSETSRLLFRDAGASVPDAVAAGGEPRDVIVSPGGATAFVANGRFGQLQVFDVTQASPVQVASAPTGAGPVALAASATGAVVAVANAAGRSLSLFNNAAAGVTPVRVSPPVAVRGDQVAVQVSGGGLGAGSLVDLGSGEFTLAHVTSGAAAFTVPALSQRDASLTLSNAGIRSLSIPLRIVDPIETTVPKPTGVVLEPNDMTCGTGPVDGALAVVRVSPDGSLLAFSREAPGCVRLDLYRITSSQGAARFGERLLDGVSWAAGGTVQDLAFTPDGRRLWAATDAGGMVEVDVDPTSPGFGTVLPFGAGAGTVRAIASDPFGRTMIVSAEPTPSTHEVQLWSPGRTLVASVPVAGAVHALAATPDGRYVVAGGEGHATIVDLDAAALVTTTPVHAVTPPDAVASVAVSSDGRRAMGVFPGGNVAVWNTDAAAGAVGAELYFGAPSPGAVFGALLPAPDGHDILATDIAGASLVEFAPGVLTIPPLGGPPPFTASPLGPVARALARTPDGRQLWAGNWNDGTLDGEVRLLATTEATELSVLSGFNQSVAAGGTLPHPVRVQITNGAGDPQAGALVRFALADAAQGSLETPGTLELDRLTDVNGETSVTWTMPATPAVSSLSVATLGVPGATAAMQATAAGSDATTAPEVVDVGPPNGATGILASTSLYVRFSQRMNRDSLALKLSLTVNGTPVATALQFVEDDRAVFVRPYNPLDYSASCVFTVAADALDAEGQRSTSARTTSFTVQAPPTLTLTAISPPSGPAGVTVTLSGDGFDPLPALNTVRIGGVASPVISASRVSLATSVSADALLGTLPVTVDVGALTSNALTYTVLPANPQPLTLSEESDARSGVEAIAITPDGRRAYITVPSLNTVLAFDLLTKSVLKSIPVGLLPQSIAITPDGARAYVANTSSDDISVIDIDPNSPTYHRVIQAPGHPVKVGDKPTSVVIAAYGPQLLVLNSGEGTVSIVDAAAGSASFDRVLSTANAGSGGKQITVTPDGTRAYIANSEGIVMLDLASKAVTTVASSGSGGKEVTISPDGTLLVALTGDGDLLIIDIAPGSLSFNRVVSSASTGSGGKQVTVSPDGTMLYVTLPDQNAVAVFRIVTGGGGGGGASVSPGPPPSLQPLGTIEVGDGPSGIAMSPDGSFAIVTNSASGTVSVLEAPPAIGNVVAGQAPATCLSTAHPCVEVPVTIARDSFESLRAFSVSLHLSSNLTLCGAGITEGTYLSDAGVSHFEVLDLGGGDYTVDGAILGSPCGANAVTGTLFTLHLGSAAASGTGTVTVTSVLLRDCVNAPISSLPGPITSITIDHTAPSALTTLAAAQVKSGSGSDGRTAITLSWPAIAAGDELLVYRAPFGNYPEYDDAPGAGAEPAPPAYPPGAPWVAVGTFTAPATGIADAPATRDVWYYVAFRRDACGNVSPVSNRTGGTLDYHLGDVHDATLDCAGDNAVGTADISFLGAHYGATLGPVDPFVCLDVGPTTDFSVNGRPTTDNRVNFEDLVMFALNYSVVSAPPAHPAAVVPTSDGVVLEAPEAVHAGDLVRATVRLRGSGAIQAVGVALGWNAAVLEPVGYESGGWIEAQGGVVLSAAAGSVDAALLGLRPQGIVGEGVLAVLTFRSRANGDPGLVVRTVEARSAANRPIVFGPGAPGAALPTHSRLEPGRPNPFEGATELRFALARGGAVELTVFGVDGRRVRTLVREERGPGEYRVAWDGADDGGRPVAPGLYFVRMNGPGFRMVRTLVRLR